MKRFTRLKNANSLEIFKSELKKWKPEHCPCCLCNLYVQNFGFIWKTKVRTTDFHGNINYFLWYNFYNFCLEINFILQVVIVYSELPFGKDMYRMKILSINLQNGWTHWFLYGTIFYCKAFSEAYPEPVRASRTDIFVKIVNGFPSLAIFAESSVSVVWLVPNRLQFLICFNLN